MKKTILLTILAGAFITSPSYAFKLSSSDDLSNMVSSGLKQAESSSALLDQVTSQLPVSDTQAAGGVGSLLSLAQSKLTGSNSSELESLIPGLDQLTSLAGSSTGTSSITDISSVNSAFEKLGLDSSMVSQFAPIVLEYLTSQGASSGLLSSLTSIWQ